MEFRNEIERIWKSKFSESIHIIFPTEMKSSIIYFRWHDTRQITSILDEVNWKLSIPPKSEGSFAVELKLPSDDNIVQSCSDKKHFTS